MSNNNRKPRAKKDNTAPKVAPKYPILIEDGLDNHQYVKRSLWGVIQDITVSTRKKWQISIDTFEYEYESFKHRVLFGIFKWLLSYSIDKNKYVEAKAVAQ